MSGEDFVGNQRKAVSHTIEGLDMMGDEPTDILVIIEVDLHQEVVLSGDGVHLGDRIHLLNRCIGDIVGLAKFAFNHNEQGLHQPSPTFRWAATARWMGTGRCMNSGT